MELFLEYGYTSLNKLGEELCGDKVECHTENGYTTLVLADGLGSGVKANILSTLTSKILCTMISSHVALQECVETIMQTLPVCKVRGISYSTFSAIHVDKEGKGWLFEYDNPQAVYFHHGHCVDFDRKAMDICGKTVYQTELQLEEGDVLAVMSDGVVHAGIGEVLNFGWDHKEIVSFLDRSIRPDFSARHTAWLLAAACNDLYADRPGDDTTVAAIKVRKPLQVNLMVGPPVHKEEDDFYVERFLHDADKRVVCGGTSSQIVARYLGKPLRTSFDFPDREIPPIGYIEGIDLVTEGVITLRRLLELSERYVSVSNLDPKYNIHVDGASLLANLLFEEATHVRFFVGQQTNQAHAGLPIDITMKLKLIERLASNMRLMGKVVEIHYN